MKNNISKIIIVIGIIFLLYIIDVKFLTYKRYIYKLSENEEIKVSLLRKDGYKFNGPAFTITKVLEDGTTTTVGEFMSYTAYNELIENVKNNEDYQVIDENKRDDAEYLFYTIDNEDIYVYIVKVEDIYFTLTNDTSIENAVKIFDRLSFERI